MCYAMERMEENKKRHKLRYAKLAPVGEILIIMRYFLILLVLCSMGQKICSQNSDSSNNTTKWDVNSKTPINDSLPLKYIIHRIKKIDKAYIIDIREEPRRFKYTIISLKVEKQYLKKIKKREQYEFVLFAYYPFLVSGDPIYSIYTIDGVRIGFKGDFKTGHIVTTPNLQGLYYIPPSGALQKTR